MSEYKVVPGPVGVMGSQCMGALSSVGSKDTERAAGAFSQIIAREVAGGWRFVCFDSTTVHSSCLWCLSKRETEMKLLVFAKD